MNHGEHVLIGSVAGTVTFVIFCAVGIIEHNSMGAYVPDFVLVQIGSFVGSVLPDKIEPPKHWTHRGFFHSKRLLIRLLICWFVGLIVLACTYSPLLVLLLFGIGGYIFHLFADSTTRRGLPSQYHKMSNPARAGSQRELFISVLRDGALSGSFCKECYEEKTGWERGVNKASRRKRHL